jgi:dienelactone hydrolase
LSSTGRFGENRCEMLNQRTRPIRLMAAMSVCGCAVAAVLAGEPQPASGPSAREAFLKVIDRPRVPLDAVARARPEADGLVTEDISFAPEAGDRVPTLLVRRPSGSARQPVVIVLHGTGGSKEGMASRLRELAGRGFVAVAIDGRYHGARAVKGSAGMSPYLEAILRTYRTGRERPFLYDTVWDVMRLIDYLVTRPDVDPARIGLTGISKGGMETYLTAAVDPRVAVAVPMIGVQSFRWALDHGAWDSRAWTLREAIDAAAKESGMGVGVPFMRRFYDKVAPGVYGDFDGPAMLPLIAPRPLLVINGDSDPRTPIGGVRECVEAARIAYAAQGAAERLVLHLQPDTGHQVTAEADRAALAWFERWLKP